MEEAKQEEREQSRGKQTAQWREEEQRGRRGERSFDRRNRMSMCHSADDISQVI